MTIYKVKCPICGTEFVTTHSKQKYGSDECAYIGTSLNRPAAKEMTRGEGIDHYRSMYRDRLLRGLRRSRYIPHLRHILRFCTEHGRMTFTCDEVAKDSPNKIRPTTLGAIGRRHDKVIRQIYKGSPGDPSIWELVMPEHKLFRTRQGY